MKNNILYKRSFIISIWEKKNNKNNQSITKTSFLRQKIYWTFQNVAIFPFKWASLHRAVLCLIFLPFEKVANPSTFVSCKCMFPDSGCNFCLEFTTALRTRLLDEPTFSTIPEHKIANDRISRFSSQQSQAHMFNLVSTRFNLVSTRTQICPWSSLRLIAATFHMTFDFQISVNCSLLLARNLRWYLHKFAFKLLKSSIDGLMDISFTRNAFYSNPSYPSTLDGSDWLWMNWWRSSPTVPTEMEQLLPSISALKH